MITTHPTPESTRADVPELPGEVVVGYDGSWHSRPALLRAAAEATARGLPLRVLSVVESCDEDEPERRAGCSPEESSPEREWQRAGAKTEAVLEDLRTTAPTLTAVAEVILDSDESRLRARFARCRLLVLGDRGRQEVRAFLLGSTSRQLVRVARCPVLVVPAELPATAQHGCPETALQRTQASAVLVGLGNGAEAAEALRVAAEEALRRARPLYVLRSYAGSAEDHRPDRAGAAWDAVQQQLRAARLDDRLRVTVILTPDPPADALVQHGELAELVVVGSRGSIALARLTMDSVSRALLDAATWPVLVVPR